MKYYIFLLAFLPVMTFCFGQRNDFKIIAYYSGNAGQVDAYDLSKVTHIIHCFSHLKGNQLDVGDNKSVATLEKLVSQKQKYPELKVLLSLGGWTGCFTCSDTFSTADNRLSFAISVKRTLEKYGADGIDLDWEYPAVEGPPGHPYKPADREHFTELVRVLRQTLGHKYSISFAAGGFDPYFEQAVEWKKVSPLVDFINLMSYDLVNGYSEYTGHHTPLYSTPENIFSVDYGVQQLLSRGVPSNKIIIGMAFYGRIWKDVADINHGLYQAGNFQSSVSIVSIEKLKDNNDFKFFWDDTARAPFIYNKNERLFYTFDNKKSVSFKTSYALSHKLGGVMFWELSLDFTSDGLLDEISKVVAGDRGKKQ